MTPEHHIDDSCPSVSGGNVAKLDFPLPRPLTPDGCDIRDFRYMKLDIPRLRRSKAWLRAKRNPELGFYMMNLWTAAWHEAPAASIEDDDDVLADLAMCDPEHWADVRGEVLRGWVKCSDGRLYHPVVAEMAMEAWEAKRAQRHRTEAARSAREAARSGKTTGTPKPLSAPLKTDPTVSVTDNVGDGKTSPHNPKGEGEGEGKREGSEEKKDPPKVPQAGDDLPLLGLQPAAPQPTADPLLEAFETWWQAYPKKVGKAPAEKVYRRVVTKQKISPTKLLDAVKGYRFSEDFEFIAHPKTWLNQARWDDVTQTKPKAANDGWVMGPFGERVQRSDCPGGL